MDKQHTDELVKRVARLVKENKELTLQLSDFSKKNEKLVKENEEFRTIIESLAPDRLKDIADLKEKTQRYKMATVLFADIQGFDDISAHGDPQDMIDELDQIYMRFDEIADKYKIHKIRTIGDTYMCVGGIPEKNHTNPIDVVLAALEMQRVIDEHQSKDSKIWKLRLGIHTGPITANVISRKKANYEVKGDTVTIASRIRASSKEGEINISGNTYELIKEFFVCEYYGKMPVKYKGDMEMYFVRQIRPEFSVEGLGTEPNLSFKTKFMLIQFDDLQEIILDKLEKELPEYLYYHNVKHTIDVVTEVELIGWAEGVSDEEIVLLKTAGLFHDAGHTISYDNHEYYGTLIAREYLPNFDYTPELIEKVCEIIMATKLPPRPKNLLEEIICDSDLDYLGRSDFIPVSNTLYKELKAQNKIGTLNEWNKLQIKFLSGHQFFTNTAQSLREVNKQKQIERIQMEITEDE